MVPEKIRETLEQNYMKQPTTYLESLYCDIAFARLHALQKGETYLEETYEEIEELILTEIALRNKERFMEAFKEIFGDEDVKRYWNEDQKAVYELLNGGKNNVK